MNTRTLNPTIIQSCTVLYVWHMVLPSPQHIGGIATEDVSERYLSQIELQAVMQIAMDLFAYELSLQYSEQTVCEHHFICTTLLLSVCFLTNTLFIFPVSYI